MAVGVSSARIHTPVSDAARLCPVVACAADVRAGTDRAHPRRVIFMVFL